MGRLTETGKVFTFPKTDPAENAYLERVQKRLAAYEGICFDADDKELITVEELSVLVKAVSLIGKNVYSNAPFMDRKVRDGGVVQVEIDRHGIEIAVDFSPEPLCGYFKISDFGNTVFLTRAEAEAALGGGGDG